MSRGGPARARSFVYGYGHLLIYGASAAAGVAVGQSVERSLDGEDASPLLGISLALLIVGFLVISRGIGRRGTPANFAAITALGVLGVVVTAVGIDATVATVVVAAGWTARGAQRS